MNQPEFPLTAPAPNPTSRFRQGSVDRRNRCVVGLVLGATLLGVIGTSAVADAAPSSARQIERRALDATSPGGAAAPIDAGGVSDAVRVRRPEVLSIECDAPAAVAGHRVHIGCSWTLPTEAPARQLTLWRSVDGAVRERVATFGWPFETSYRDVVPAGTEHVAYAIIGTNSAGKLVARSRADRVRLPTLPSADTPSRAEMVPVVVTPEEPTSPTVDATTTSPAVIESGQPPAPRVSAETRPTTTEPPSQTPPPPASVPAVAADPMPTSPAVRPTITQPSIAAAPRADEARAQRGDDG